MAQLSLCARSTPCGIGLGSNLGNRIENLIRAARAIISQAPGAQLTGTGGVYETVPVDCPSGSASFLNTVIEIETDTGPHDLLAILLQIERTMGRADVREKNAPRMIDLDILYIGDRVIAEREIQVPHPRLHERRFVLQPLDDFRPALILPRNKRTVRELLEALNDDPLSVTLIRREWLDARL